MAQRAPLRVEVDVCVYAATPGGIQAAVAAKREGRTVVLVEPGRWVGGILGAGIKPRQDCPNIEAVGGSTRRLLETLGGADEGKSDREISPRDIRDDFLALLREHEIRVIYDHRIARCVKAGTTLQQAVFDLAPFDERGIPPEASLEPASLTVQARVFIDASYEGDLLRHADVSFVIGRESTLDWNESAAGVREPSEVTPLDPFVRPGEPASGLLPLVEPAGAHQVGSGDRFTQAYNFRYYVTDDPQHRAPFTPPENYDARAYELVGRYVDHLVREFPETKELHARLSRIFPGWMNSGEYNYHRRSLFTMAPVGISHRLAAADAGGKSRLWRAHQDYLRGLHLFLSTDSRVPAAFREQTARLGLDRRHHADTNGWPHQLYIRVARRLVGHYTITEHDVYNRTSIEDPIALAQYGIDTYPSRRIWFERDGRTYVGLEGWMWVGGAQGPTRIPYPVSYRAITPLRHECTNLLVPVCFSATHLGYASARMEPVFMMCGESAGVAAHHAIEQNVPVQDIDQPRFQARLKEIGQVLAWPVSR